nr:polysaccharide biosynthesis C-terminal domain-containing protein [Pseudoalteromonas sp. WY3]
MFITLPALIGFCVLAKPITELLLGDEYLAHGLTIIYILCAAVFIQNLKGHYIIHGLQFSLNTKYIPRISLISLLINLILLILLMPEYGLEGAALSFLITSFISLLMGLYISLKQGYKFVVSTQVYKIVFSSICMAFVLNEMQFYNFISSFNLVLYLGLYVVIGIFFFYLL